MRRDPRYESLSTVGTPYAIINMDVSPMVRPPLASRANALKSRCSDVATEPRERDLSPVGYEPLARIRQDGRSWEALWTGRAWEPVPPCGAS